MHASETDHTLSHELREGELQAMADCHEAEILLFQYIMTSSGQLETPPVILKKLADNLGDPQRLPATKILQTAVLHPPMHFSTHSSANSSIAPSAHPSPHPLSHPLSTLIAMEGILENTFEDSAAAFEEELASSGRGDRSTPWISLENSEGEGSLEKEIVFDNEIIFENGHISEVSLQAKPLIERKKQRLFPAGKIFFIGLAIIYGYMVLKTGSLSPLAIFDTIKNQRQTPMQVESPLENHHPEGKQNVLQNPSLEKPFPPRQSGSSEDRVISDKPANSKQPAKTGQNATSGQQTNSEQTDAPNTDGPNSEDRSAHAPAPSSLVPSSLIPSALTPSGLPPGKQDAVNQPPHQERGSLPHQKAYPGVVILPDTQPGQKHDQRSDQSDQQQSTQYGRPSE